MCIDISIYRQGYDIVTYTVMTYEKKQHECHMCIATKMAIW